MLNVLKYEKKLPSGDFVGGFRELVWPFNVFRVTLPVREKQTDINAFESLLLSFLSIGRFFSEDILANETCLPKELVHVIIRRLQDRGFLDESFNIIEEKQHYWEQLHAEDDITYKTVLLFQDHVSGKLMPYIEINPPKNDTGFSYKKSYHVVIPRSNDQLPKPNPHDVIITLQRIREQNNASKKSCVFSLSDQQIKIIQKPELYYLCCPIVIQGSDDTDFRIVNPFERNYSSLLEYSFQRLLTKDDSIQKWYSDWREQLVRPVEVTEGTKVLFSFETPYTIGKYPELINNLKPGHKGNRSVLKIYASLEWAFFYYCHQFSCSETLRLLKLISETDLPDELSRIALTLGFSEYKRSFKSVRPGKILDFINGKAEMPTLIAIVLLQQKNVVTTNALTIIASKYPDFFERLQLLKEHRDRIEHGSQQQDPDQQLVDDPLMQEVIHILLPEIVFTNNVNGEVARSRDDIINKKILARSRVQGFWGYNLKADLMDRLISAEFFWLRQCCSDSDTKIDDAMPLVNDLYASCQMLFRDIINNSSVPEIKDEDFLSEARKKAKNAGFKELPERICSTNSERVRQTLLGKDQTLGACILAFLIIASEQALLQIAQEHNDFLANLADIIALRGHGNMSQSLTKEQIKELRKSTNNTIKTLLEV